MWPWIIVLVVIALLYIAAAFGGYCFFRVAFDSSCTRVTQLLVRLTGYTGSPHQDAAKKGLELMNRLAREDVHIFSKDALKLHGTLFCFEDHPKKFVLGMHGYKSRAWNEYAPFISFYRSVGYSMLLPDNRGHGQSEGKYVGLGNLDKDDCILWAKYLVERFGEDIEIILHGVSMGGATVLSAAGDSGLPRQVKGVISDCAFTSIRDEFKHQMHELFHAPSFPCVPVCEKICEHRLHMNFTDGSPIQQVKKAKVPVLFVHGDKDRLVPHWMGHILYDNCRAPKKMLTVEGAGHAQSIGVSPVQYKQEITDFFGIGA